MSQPPPQPPELPSGPPDFLSGPPSLPTGPPALPPAAPVYLPSPTPRSLASRPIFWIVLVVGILAFISFLAAAGFAGYSKVIKRVKEKQAQKELTTQLEQIQREQSRAMREEYDNTGRLTGSGLQGADKMLDVLENAGKGASEDAITTRAAATWFKNISDAAKHLEEMTRPLGTSGIMDIGKLKGSEGLASNRGVINQTILENQSLLDQFENTETNFKELLLLEGLSPSKATVLAKQFAGTIKEGMPFIRKIRNAEIQRMNLFLKSADLLEAERDKWAVKDGTLLFESQEAAEKYNEFNNALKRLSEEQAEAQQRLVEFQEKE